MPDYLREKQRGILKGYLREYFAPVPEKYLVKLQAARMEVFKKDYFICGSRESLRPAVTFYLLSGGRKTWKVINAYDLLEIYLGHVEDFKSIFELGEPHIIITHGNQEFVNRRQWDIINQFCAWRNLSHRRTMIFGLGQRSYTEFKAKFAPDLMRGFQIIMLGS